MSIEENKDMFRRFVQEGFNQGNLDLVDDAFDPAFVNHDPDLGTTPDREGLKQFIGLTRGAFPDLRITIEDLVAEGDKAVARMTLTGTHTGELMGIQATGKQVTVSVISIIRSAGGKAVERWSITDRLSMMQQLGAPAG